MDREICWHFNNAGKKTENDFFFLRTVPPFATAHAFCVSRDGPRNSRFLTTVPTNSKVFLWGKS